MMFTGLTGFESYNDPYNINSWIFGIGVILVIVFFAITTMIIALKEKEVKK